MLKFKRLLIKYPISPKKYLIIKAIIARVTIIPKP